jgi:hypothetical protein
MRLTDGDRMKLKDAHTNLNVLIKAFNNTNLIDRKIARGLMRNLEKIRSAVAELELEFHYRLIDEVKTEKH